MMNIKKTTTLIATVAAVLSMTMAFIPDAAAQSFGSGLALTLQADCGFTTNDQVVAQNVDPGAVTTAVFSVDLQNSGTASLPVDANIGDFDTPGAPVGGFAEAPRTAQANVAVLPSDVTMNADDGIGAVGTVSMLDTGTDVNIAALGPTGAEGEGSDRTVVITASLTNLQNLPAVGLQTATVTFTGGLCA